jgi:ParB-like chromosome segregation protein Spo0J
MMNQEILVPNPEVVATSELKVDGKNPNKMSREQHERLKTSIKKYGFIVPIITNKDLLIADGEQRWIVAKELAMSNVLVIRLPVEEVDRRLLRQVLNKLKGTHDRELDAEEFEAIIELGREDDLKYLLNLSDDKLDGYLKEEESIGYEKQFEVVVECEDEINQEATYNKLIQEGYKCRVLTL